MLMRRRPLLLLLWLAAALPQAVEAAWFDRTEAIMGTRIYVQVGPRMPPRATRRSIRSYRDAPHR
jgi:hypothetical protein